MAEHRAPLLRTVGLVVAFTVVLLLAFAAIVAAPVGAGDARAQVSSAQTQDCQVVQCNAVFVPVQPLATVPAVFIPPVTVITVPPVFIPTVPVLVVTVPPLIVTVPPVIIAPATLNLSVSSSPSFVEVGTTVRVTASQNPSATMSNSATSVSVTGPNGESFSNRAAGLSVSIDVPATSSGTWSITATGSGQRCTTAATLSAQCILQTTSDSASGSFFVQEPFVRPVITGLAISVNPPSPVSPQNVTVSASMTTVGDSITSQVLTLTVTGPGGSVTNTGGANVSVTIPSASPGSYSVTADAFMEAQQGEFRDKASNSTSFTVEAPAPTATFTPTPTTGPTTAAPTATFTPTPTAATVVDPPTATPTRAPSTPTPTSRPVTPTPEPTRLSIVIPLPSETPTPEPTSTPVPDCMVDLDDAEVTPTKGRAGTLVTVSGKAAPGPGCSDEVLLMSLFDGATAGDAVIVDFTADTDPVDVELAFAVPADAEAGEHELTVVSADGSGDEQPVTALAFAVVAECTLPDGALALTDLRTEDPPVIAVTLSADDQCQDIAVAYRIEGGGTDFTTAFAPLGPDGTDTREIEMTSSDETIALSVTALGEPVDPEVPPAELAFAELGESDEGGESSLVLPIAAATVATAVIATTAVVRRRRKIHDPCEVERAIFERALAKSNAMEAEVAAAEAQVETAKTALSQARSDHHACASRETPLVPGEKSGLSLGHLVPFVRWKKGGEVPMTDAPLTEHTNPNAPTHSTGEQGWFRPERRQPIDSVVVHQGLANQLSVTDVDQMIEAFESAERARSVHVIAHADGLIRLLPDDYVARHADGWHVQTPVDDRSLSVAIVAANEEEWNQARGHAGSWIAEAVEQHSIDAREVTLAQLAGGGSGLAQLGVAPYPTDDDDPLMGELDKASDGGFRSMLTPFIKRPAGAAAPDAAPTCDPERARVQEAEAELANAETGAAKAEERAIRSAEELNLAITALDACTGGQAERGKRRTRVSAAPVAAPEPIEQQADTHDAWLLTHPNPNAQMRDNGISGHFHTTRLAPIDSIVVHTAESGATSTSEGVASWLSVVPEPASAHVATDSTHYLTLLPDHFTAFHAKRGNSRSLGIEICYNAALWGTGSAAYEQALVLQAARWCAMKAALYNIPARHLSGNEYFEGFRGFVGHGQIQPEDRTDPGPSFPWSDFLALVEKFSLGMAADE